MTRLSEGGIQCAYAASSRSTRRMLAPNDQLMEKYQMKKIETVLSSLLFVAVGARGSGKIH